MCKRVLVLLSCLAVVTVLLPLASASGSAPEGQGAAEVVKIGILTPVESAGVSNPDDPDAFQAAIAWFNKRGGAGANHARIRGVVCDTRSDPNREVECAREMVEEGVVATDRRPHLQQPGARRERVRGGADPPHRRERGQPGRLRLGDLVSRCRRGRSGEYVGASAALSGAR